MTTNEPTNSSALDELQCVDTHTAANLLGIHENTLIRLYHEHKIKAKQISPRKLRWPLFEIRKYLQGGSQEGQEAKPTRRRKKG